MVRNLIFSLFPKALSEACNGGVEPEIDGSRNSPGALATETPSLNPKARRGAITGTDGPDRVLDKLLAIAQLPVETVEQGLHVRGHGRIDLSQAALATIMRTSKSNAHRWLGTLEKRGLIKLETNRNGTQISIVSITQATAPSPRTTEQK